jgi:hypothetical protein
MSFCPKWIFEVACASAGMDYLGQQTDLGTVAKSYAVTLGTHYNAISDEEVSAVVEAVVRFLDELKAGETAVELLKGFMCYRVTYEMPNKPRKLRGLFGSADEPVKTKEHSADDAVKSFRAYVYALRNNVAEVAPPGWRLADVEGSEVLKALAEQEINPLDFL